MNRRSLLTAASATGINLAAVTGQPAAADVAEWAATPSAGRGDYAEVNGLRMYYEIHGAGEPLVLLHGSFMNIDLAFAAYIPALAASRRVIAVEVQGHGRTADRDTPLRYASLADDVVALLDRLAIDRADVFGYSMGASIGLELAIAQPGRMRRLIALSTVFARDGMHPAMAALFETISPEFFMVTPIYAEYVKYAPNPDDFPALVEKIIDLERNRPDFTPEQIAGITAPTLIIIGDADGTTLEHAVTWFRLMGGGVAGDLQPLPPARLGIIPGATHVTVLMKSDQVLPMVTDFLAAVS